MYSFYLMGHDSCSNMYTVRFNPDTQDVSALPLGKLLHDTFYNRPCYGSIYRVVTQDSKVRNPEKDFRESVDRRHMTLRQNAEFFGVELVNSFYVKTKVYAETTAENCNVGHCKSPSRHTYLDKEESDNDFVSSSSDSSDDVVVDADSDSDADTPSNEKDIDLDGDKKLVHNSQLNEEHGTAGFSDEGDVQIGNDHDIHPDPDFYSNLPFHSRPGTETNKIHFHPDYYPDYFKELETNTFLCEIDQIGFLTKLEIEPDQDSPYYQKWKEIYQKHAAYVMVCKDVSIGDRYLKKLTELSLKRNVTSATFVSLLTEPLGVDTSDVCLCFFDQAGGYGSKQFFEKCRTFVYNHLVFDFQENQMVVEGIEEDDVNYDCLDCPFKLVLNSHVENESRLNSQKVIGFW